MPRIEFGKALMGMGVFLFSVGALLYFAKDLSTLSAIFGRLGNLPGDIKIERDGFRFYFPLTTSLLVSGIVSAILYLLRK